MGGIGSGSWCRWDARYTTQDAHSVDIRYLKQHGFLRGGVSGALRWSCNDEETGSIRFRTESDRLVLNYRYRASEDEWEWLEYPVYFDQTPCNYGGIRKWFLCPNRECGRRVAVLYAVGKYFLCRHCQDLVYQSQRECPAQRAMRRSRKIILQLGGEPDDESYPDRPKYMHHTTYDRLIQEAERCNQLSWAMLEPLLRRFITDIPGTLSDESGHGESAGEAGVVKASPG